MSNLKSAPRICSISLENVTFGEVTVPTVSEDGLLVLSGDVGASAAGLTSVGGWGLASPSSLFGGLSAEDSLSVLVTGVLGGGSEKGGMSTVVGVASVEEAESAGSLGAGCIENGSFEWSLTLTRAPIHAHAHTHTHTHIFMQVA